MTDTANRLRSTHLLDLANDITPIVTSLSRYKRDNYRASPGFLAYEICNLVFNKILRIVTIMIFCRRYF